MSSAVAAVLWIGAAARAFAGPKAVGATCTSTCSGAHMGCYGGFCACAPGYSACGTSCVDTTSDKDHCGACGVTCVGNCQRGVCEKPGIGPQPLPPVLGPSSSSASDGFDVTPGECNEYESRPVLSANSDMVFQADASDAVSWASTDTPDTWKVSGRVKAAPDMSGDPAVTNNGFMPPACMPPSAEASLPLVTSIVNSCPAASGGDIWATTSGFSGEEYVLARTSWNYWMPMADADKEPVACTTKDDCKKANPSVCKQTGQCECDKLPKPNNKQKACFIHNSAPGGVDVSPTDLESGDFKPAMWVDDLDASDDGLTFDYDPGAAFLWGASTCGKPTGHQGNVCLSLFAPCKAGTIGGPDCKQVPFSGSPDHFAILMGKADAGRDNLGHTTVVANPCTHHALVSFIDSDKKADAYVVVEAVDDTGAIVARWEYAEPLPWGDTQCPIDNGAAMASCTARPLCPTPSAVASDTVCHGGSTEGSAVSRIVLRAPMEVQAREVNGTMACTLYVGFDQSVPTIPAKPSYAPMRHAASLGWIDVSDDGSGTESKTATFSEITQVDLSNGESFDSTPVVSRFSDAMGLLYVQRDPSGTWEGLRARVTTDPTFSSWTDMPVSGWQAAQFVWEGDNLAQLRGGLPGGKLLATWPYLRKKNCTTIEGSLLDVVPVAAGTQTYVPLPLVQGPIELGGDSSGNGDVLHVQPIPQPNGPSPTEQLPVDEDSPVP
jgi:hypothetical protein